jgi:hypothetical protein
MKTEYKKYEYLLEIMNKNGELIEAEIFVTRTDEYAIFQRISETIDNDKYQFNITYLGVIHKPRKLVKLQPGPVFNPIK